MKRRLPWITILFCSVLLAQLPSCGKPTSTEVRHQAPSSVHPVLRFFQFRADRCMPETVVPASALPPTPTPSININVPVPHTSDAVEIMHNTWSNCRHGMSNIGHALNVQVEKVQGASRWCSDTAGKVTDLYNSIGESYRRLSQLSAQFSPPAKTPATTPATPKPVKRPVVYRYTWVNERGDQFFTNNRKFDPNRGGKRIWHRDNSAVGKAN